MRCFKRSVAAVGALAVGMAIVSAAPGRAADGRLEINQTCAVNTGCFPGDGAGFPVTISNPGSYLFTGDMSVPVDVSGIMVQADDVTLDLNGFRLLSAGGTLTSADGIEGTDRTNIEVRNGTVEGFRGRGIGFFGASQSVRIIDMRLRGTGFQGVDLDGDGHLVSRCTSNGNALWGFSLDGDSLIVDSVAQGNTLFGLVLDPETGFRGNLVSGNNGGSMNSQVSGGFNIGDNLCGTDPSCP